MQSSRLAREVPARSVWAGSPARTSARNSFIRDDPSACAPRACGHRHTAKGSSCYRCSRAGCLTWLAAHDTPTSVRLMLRAAARIQNSCQCIALMESHLGRVGGGEVLEVAQRQALWQREAGGGRIAVMRGAGLACIHERGEEPRAGGTAGRAMKGRCVAQTTHSLKTVELSGRAATAQPGPARPHLFRSSASRLPSLCGDPQQAGRWPPDAKPLSLGTRPRHHAHITIHRMDLHVQACNTSSSPHHSPHLRIDRHHERREAARLRLLHPPRDHRTVPEGRSREHGMGRGPVLAQLRSLGSAHSPARCGQGANAH
jgi:hypothetical protein